MLLTSDEFENEKLTKRLAVNTYHGVDVSVEVNLGGDPTPFYVVRDYTTDGVIYGGTDRIQAIANYNAFIMNGRNK